MDCNMDFCVFRFPCTRLFLVSQQTTKYSLRDGDVDCYVFPFPVHRTGSSTLADYYKYINGWSNGFGCFSFPFHRTCLGLPADYSVSIKIWGHRALCVFVACQQDLHWPPSLLLRAPYEVESRMPCLAVSHSHDPLRALKAQLTRSCVAMFVV